MKLKNNFKTPMYNGLVIGIGTVMIGMLGNYIVNSDNFLIIAILWIVVMFLFDLTIALLEK